MTLFRRAARVPERLRTALGPDEPLLGMLRTTDDEVLAATRFGLWRVVGEVAERWDWHLISRARLAGGVLAVTVAEQVDTWPDGIAVLRDRPETILHPQRLTKLTDTVHHRVSRSVMDRCHLDWPGSGGWVVLRKVPGADGLAVQVRLDPGADPDADGFAAAARAVADEIWPPEVPRRSAPDDTH